MEKAKGENEITLLGNMILFTVAGPILWFIPSIVIGLIYSAFLMKETSYYEQKSQRH